MSMAIKEFSVKKLMMLGCVVLLLSCRDSGAQSPLPEADAQANPSLVIADFEQGELRNRLGGECGAWNLDPMDENSSYTDVDLVEMPGLDGQMNTAVKLTYSVESEVPSQNGFWIKLMSLDASDYDHLEFDVKGDPEGGFTERMKIALYKIQD